MGEVEPVEAALPGEALRQPADDLAQDHPGVATGAEQRALAEPLGDGLDARVVAHVVEHLAAGRDHVRARVPVGHREHVERVDLVDVHLEVGDGRADRLEEPGAVAGEADHLRGVLVRPARRASGLPATSTPDGANGPVSRPSTWIVTAPTSRPSARRSA